MTPDELTGDTTKERINSKVLAWMTGRGGPGLAWATLQ
jgi:hypothetical protein